MQLKIYPTTTSGKILITKQNFDSVTAFWGKKSLLAKRGGDSEKEAQKG